MFLTQQFSFFQAHFGILQLLKPKQFACLWGTKGKFLGHHCWLQHLKLSWFDELPVIAPLVQQAGCTLMFDISRKDSSGVKRSGYPKLSQTQQHVSRLQSRTIVDQSFWVSDVFLQFFNEGANDNFCLKDWKGPKCIKLRLDSGEAWHENVLSGEWIYYLWAMLIWVSYYWIIFIIINCYTIYSVYCNTLSGSFHDLPYVGYILPVCVLWLLD